MHKHREYKNKSGLHIGTYNSYKTYKTYMCRFSLLIILFLRQSRSLLRESSQVLVEISSSIEIGIGCLRFSVRPKCHSRDRLRGVKFHFRLIWQGEVVEKAANASGDVLCGLRPTPRSVPTRSNLDCSDAVRVPEQREVRLSIENDYWDRRVGTPCVLVVEGGVSIRGPVPAPIAFSDKSNC